MVNGKCYIFVQHHQCRITHIVWFLRPGFHWSFFYPPGSKSVALQLGVHLILLYFIRIWSWVRRLFFYFGGGWWVVDGWWIKTFWFFKSLDINLVYTLGLYMYIFSYSDKCRKSSCGFQTLDKLEVRKKNQKHPLGWMFLKKQSKSNFYMDFPVHLKLKGISNFGWNFSE